MRRAARLLTQQYEKALKPIGMQPTQFTLLAMLKAQSNKDGIQLTTLAKYLGLDRTTLTRNLSLTEKKGWTENSLSEDRRERLIKLTDTGSKKLQEAMPYWEQAQTSIVNSLGEKEFKALLSQVNRLQDH